MIKFCTEYPSLIPNHLRSCKLSDVVSFELSLVHALIEAALARPHDRGTDQAPDAPAHVHDTRARKVHVPRTRVQGSEWDRSESSENNIVTRKRGGRRRRRRRKACRRGRGLEMQAHHVHGVQSLNVLFRLLRSGLRRMQCLIRG